MKLLFVFGAFLLLQDLVSVSSQKLTEREQEQVLGIEELAKHTNRTLHQYQDVFEPTIKDIENKPPVSEDVQKKLDEFRAISDRIDNLPKELNIKFLDEVFDLNALAEETITKYYKYQNENSDDLINAKFREHGMNSLVENSMYIWVVFSSNLEQRVRDYKALPESERKLNPDMVAWFNKYKTGEIKKNHLFSFIGL